MPIQYDAKVLPQEKASIDGAFKDCRILIDEVLEEYWGRGRRPDLYKGRVQEFFGMAMTFPQLKSKLMLLKNFLNEKKIYVTTAISVSDHLSFFASEYPVSHRYAEADYEACKIAFRARFFKTNAEERALTFFHELTHLALQTEDYEITAGNAEETARQLAKENSTAAISSAHNFELFMKYAFISNHSPRTQKREHYHEIFKNMLSSSGSGYLTFGSDPRHYKRFTQEAMDAMEIAFKK